MKAVCVVAALSAFAVLPSRSQASPIVVYDNFGPGQSYNIGGWNVAGPTNPDGPAFEQAVAEPFTPATTVTLDSVLVPIFPVGATNSVIVSLRSDVIGPGGAEPGAPLESFTVTGLPAGGTVFELDSISHPILDAGTTYWIAVFPGTSDGFAAWNENTTGASGISFTFDGGNTWNWDYYSSTFGNTSAAFEVLGNQVSTPEPSSLAMLAGLGACIIGRRRRRIGPIR
jgi:hypothetical protein